MTTVGVADLKAHLSAVLARVHAGESVTVTDRGRPVAHIVPVASTDEPGEHLAALARAGLVTLGRGTIPSAYWALSLPIDKAGSSLAAVLEDRDGGW